ncbi:TLD-domain-containing protein [Blakeslea trispora]|nr:TLD-domain-containing protein [Blakeslea trispora]
MSIKFTPTPSSILTPSTIECTQFYSQHERRVSLPVITQRKRNSMTCFHDIKKKYNFTQFETKKRSMSLPVLPTTTLIHLTNRHPSTFICLEKDLAQNIQAWLPPRISISSQWSLVYSLDQHGASLNTLYYRCRSIHGPCLLVIQDSQDQIFGAYLSEGIRVQSNCYGTGECFLWKKDKKTDRVDIYPWTTANDYLIYSDHDFFAMGGGQGHFGYGCIQT